MKDVSRDSQGNLLDFGCGKKPYERLFADNVDYIGLDLEPLDSRPTNNKADVYFDGVTIPFPKSNFDQILCTEVLEHVFDINLTLKEMNRVLKPNGRLLLTIPFMFGEHEKPYDFGRYTSYGITHLLKQNGFEVESIRKSPNALLTILQLSITSLFDFLDFSPKKFGKVFLIVLLAPMSLINLLSIPASHFHTKGNNIYLSLNIVARKV
jgi:SAM-dependent methyltransferase